MLCPSSLFHVYLYFPPQASSPMPSSPCNSLTHPSSSLRTLLHSHNHTLAFPSSLPVQLLSGAADTLQHLLPLVYTSGLMALLFAFQREGSAERTNGRPEEVTPRETAAHLTNGDSPNRQSPVLLSREPQVSPKPLCVGEYRYGDVFWVYRIFGDWVGERKGFGVFWIRL